MIGDQRTAALLTRSGDIVWYCPDRFDRPSIFGALLDKRGGAWRLDIPGSRSIGRAYVSSSAVLETHLSCAGHVSTVTDFMPMGSGVPRGICRILSAVRSDAILRFEPAPNFGQSGSMPLRVDAGVRIGNDTLFASHALTIEDGHVLMHVPSGDESWATLLASDALRPNASALQLWRRVTIDAWESLASNDKHHAGYDRGITGSLRALRLLTHAESGGVIAAVTTSLPEVKGGDRNYDYRYVWLRDAGMIASALIRSAGDVGQARRLLDFLGSSKVRSDDIFLPPALTLSGETVPEELTVDGWVGYGGASPVRKGNGARTQLQLDAVGNILLVAKLVYGATTDRPQFAMIRDAANFLTKHWQEADFGLWEEREPAQYTSSKVIMACGLEFIAEYGDKAEALLWRQTATAIRAFVITQCMTTSGAYAAIAGGEDVDVSAALFPVWAYCDADTPTMLVTIAEIERDLADGALYRRLLLLFPSHEEGAFLAGTFWVAQYWIMRGDLERARSIIDATLAYSNDLGFFAEEGDPATGEMVGNFPQSFVHAAFLGTVFDLATETAKMSGGRRDAE